MVTVTDKAAEIRYVKAGIKVHGKIVRSKEWIKERVRSLNQKKLDLQKRIENIDEEISLRESEIKKALTESEISEKYSLKEQE